MMLQTQEGIAITVDHRVAEHVRAERLYYARRSRFATVDRVVGVLLVAFGLVSIALVGVRWWTVIWLVVGPLEFFNLLSIAPLVVRYRFARMPKFQQPSELVFGQEVVHYRTDDVKSELLWSTWTELLEDERLFLLVYGPRAYALVPKRCFAGPAEIDEFRALAQRQLAA